MKPRQVDAFAAVVKQVGDWPSISVDAGGTVGLYWHGVRGKKFFVDVYENGEFEWEAAVDGNETMNGANVTDWALPPKALEFCADMLSLRVN